MIDQETVERIKTVTNIVDVVSDYVSLSRAGASYKGLCPFHDERTPSFMVSPARNTCHCFGCGKGGDAISFLKELNGFTYRQALEHLANKYHIEIKEEEVSAEEKLKRQKKEALLICNEYATTFYCNALKGDSKAKAAMYDIGINEATAITFRLGYADSGHTALCDAATAKGHNIATYQDLGLIVNKNGDSTDQLSNALTVPVMNRARKTISFCPIGIGEPHDIGEPLCNPLFNVSYEVFGRPQATQSIAKQRRCLIAHTPVDVMLLSQAGLTNSISSFSGNVSQYILTDLFRLATDITILYNSGWQKEIKKEFDLADNMLRKGFSITVCDITPLEPLHTLSATEIAEYINDNAIDYITFKTDFLLSIAGDDELRTVKALHNILRTIMLIPEDVSRTIFMRMLSERTGFGTDTLEAEQRRLTTTTGK